MRNGKSIVRRVAELALGGPHRMNDSAVYRAYLKLRYPAHYEAGRLQRRFYHQLIRDAGAGLVIDVGANAGEKAIIFAEVADRVLCVEPSPAAVRALQARFAGSGKITIVGKGAGAQPGSLPFHMFDDDDCYNTFSSKWAASLSAPDGSSTQAKKVTSIVEVPVVTLDALIEELGVPSYIKIDVEGFELEVLKGLSRSVRLVSIECNLPQFTQETLDCIARLGELQRDAVFNYCTSEPPVELASKRWLSPAEMADQVKSGRHRFMEIYARPR